MDASHTVFAQVVLAIITVTGFAAQIYREHRNREWLTEDRDLSLKERKELALKVEEEASALAVKSAIGQNELSKHMELHAKVLESMLEANMQLSNKAFAEANNFNEKLEKSTNRATREGEERGQKIDGLLKATEKQQTQLIKIADVGKDTHALVNGSMGTQLRIAAVLARRVAELTGHEGDKKAAEIAEIALAEHDAKEAAIPA